MGHPDALRGHRGRRSEPLSRGRVLPVAWLLATLAASAPGPAAALEPSRAQNDVDLSMREGAYPFCREPRVPLSREALALCPHAAAVPGCEGFAAACTRPEPRRWSFDLPEWLDHAVGWLVRWTARGVAWVLLPGLGVALLVPVLRALFRKRAPGFGPPTRDPDVAHAAPVGPPELEPAADVDVLLARADDETRRRAYDAAMELYLAAGLVSLDRRGALRLARDRTNGEYVRACSEPAAKATLRALTAEVDQVKFGGRPATPEGAERAGAAARRIVQGAAVAIAGLLLLGCTGCGGGHWPGLPRAGDDPAGKELLFDVLRRQGIETGYLGGALASLPLPEPGERGAAVLVDLEKTELDEDTATHLVEWVAAGGSLVLAGAPEEWPKELGVTPAFGGEALGVQARRLLARGEGDPETEDDDDAQEDDAPATPAGPVYAATVEHGELAASAGLVAGDDGERIAWLDDGTTYAVAVPHGLGWVTGIATGELLTNVALARPGNASAALAILSSADRQELKIAQAEDGVSPPSTPLAAIQRAGLGLGLGHALVAALLLFAAAGVRLARPVPAPAPARRAFVEHVEAVGQLYLQGGHAQHALAAFARFADQRLRAKMPRGASDVPAFLAARARVPLEACQRLWARGIEAGAAPPVGDELGILKELSAVYSLAVDQER